MRRLLALAGSVALLAAGAGHAADSVSVATVTASSGTVAVPVFVRDESGTPLGVDAQDRIQALSIQVSYAPAQYVSHVSIARSGILAGLSPTFEAVVPTSSGIAYIGSWDQAKAPLPFTLDAAAPGDEVLAVTLELSPAAPAGTVIALTLDPELTTLSNQGGTVTESAADGDLLLGNGSVTVSIPTGCRLTATLDVPSVADAGEDVAFAAAPQLSGCTTAIQASWDFGDQTPVATGLNADHAYSIPGTYTWHFTATAGDSTYWRDGTVMVLDPARKLYMVPAVAHRPGLLGTVWRTDLAATDPGEAPVALELAYTAEDGGFLTATAELQAGGLELWENVVESLFGAPASDSTAGAVLVWSDAPLLLQARTYNTGGDGTYGQAMPALEPRGTLTTQRGGVVPYLARTSALRSNLGFVNLSLTQCTLLAYVRDGTGAERPAQVLDLGAQQWTQLNDVLHLAGLESADAASARIQVATPGCLAWAYGSVVDNATGDPTTVPVERLAAPASGSASKAAILKIIRLSRRARSAPREHGAVTER